MQAKMHVAACIFDAYLYQGLVGISLLPLARQLLAFFENHKISRVVVLRGPGGMRRGAGGDFEGVRDLQDVICNFGLVVSI